MIKDVEILKDIENNLDKKDFLIQFLPKMLEDILTQYKRKTIFYQSKYLKKSYLIDIIHNLIYKSYICEKITFNLSSEVLKIKYGKNYNYYIKWLIRKELIFKISEYMVGKKCRTYKLNERLKENITRYKNTDKILIRKHKNNLISNEIQKKNSSWIQPWIRQRLVKDLFSVKINYQKAEDILFTLEDDKSYLKNRFSVDSINNSDIFYTFDDYGRFHTNFTTLKGSIRKCLKIDNHPLMELDIKNSQPLFFTKMLKDNLDKIEKSEYEYFSNLVKRGEFYDRIKEVYNLKTKKDAKKLTYKIFFGKNKRIEKKFKTIFPTIYKFIVDFKKEKNDYKALAYELQRSESRFIFNDICKTIYTRYPDVKLLTIHDSISFPSIYKNKIEEIWENKLSNIF